MEKILNTYYAKNAKKQLDIMQSMGYYLTMIFAVCKGMEVIKWQELI